jgi:hypothetical protein
MYFVRFSSKKAFSWSELAVIAQKSRYPEKFNKIFGVRF